MIFSNLVIGQSILVNEMNAMNVINGLAMYQGCTKARIKNAAMFISTTAKCPVTVRIKPMYSNAFIFEVEH